MKKFFSNFEENVCFLILNIMLTLAFSNVISRYFLHASISFTEEITTSLFVLLCTLGTAIAAKRGAHLGLSVITEHLSKKTENVLAGVANLLAAVFSGVLFYTGTLMALNQFQINAKSITLQWPGWIYGSFLPIGALFMVIRFGQVAICRFKEIKRIQE